MSHSHASIFVSARTPRRHARPEYEKALQDFLFKGSLVVHRDEDATMLAYVMTRCIERGTGFRFLQDGEHFYTLERWP